jgi:hypothetical protein
VTENIDTHLKCYIDGDGLYKDNDSFFYEILSKAYTFRSFKMLVTTYGCFKFAFKNTEF